MTIDASSLPAGVTISGGGTSRIFTVSDGQTVALQNLTLTGGNGTGGVNPGGGAILNGGGTLTLTNSIVAGNTAPGGADIYFNAGFGGSVTGTGANLIGNNDTVESTFPVGLPRIGQPGNLANALLAPLAAYGGPTKTMALLLPPRPRRAVGGWRAPPEAAEGTRAVGGRAGSAMAQAAEGAQLF